jgi:ribosomal protein S18 acetylase RimI-like enzyme
MATKRKRPTLEQHVNGASPRNKRVKQASTPAASVTKKRSRRRVNPKYTSSNSRKPRRTLEEQAANVRAESLVTAANALPLDLFGAKYIQTNAFLGSLTGNGGQEFMFELENPSTLGQERMEKLIHLIEDTSGADYKGSSAGWDVGHKREEMGHEDMRFLIVKDRGNGVRRVRCDRVDQGEGGGQNGQLKGEEESAPTTEGAVAGFLSFMLTTEETESVIYIYEIHLYEWARGAGLGGWLMSVVEEIGRRVGVDKAMLSVFATNERAEKFYRARGYGEDELCPSWSMGRLKSGKVRKPEYYIMSKSLQDDGVSIGPTSSLKMTLRMSKPG